MKFSLLAAFAVTSVIGLIAGNIGVALISAVCALLFAWAFEKIDSLSNQVDYRDHNEYDESES